MCVDGKCGTFTTEAEEAETKKKFVEMLTETAAEIASELPDSMPAELRAILGAAITAKLVGDHFRELAQAEHVAAPAA